MKSGAEVGQGKITVEIERIEKDRLEDAKNLVTKGFMKYEAPDYSDEGVKAFFDTAIHNRDYMNSLVLYGAYRNNLLVGVIAARNEGNHIALFFVDGEYHKQGIGRKLFETVLEHSTEQQLTVNSSPYAKEVYHHLGFEDIDVEQSVTGIRFTPMIYRK